MKLSADQVRQFWQLWPQACAANRWTREAGMTATEIDAKRKEFLAGCGFDSLTHVDRTAGYTKVKNGLLVMIGTSVKAGLEVNDPTLNQARVWRKLIRTEILPCLALYEADVHSYMVSVMEDKNRWWKIDRPARDIRLEDLDAKPVVKMVRGELRESASTLEQLLMTLNARLHAKRRAAKHTIHDMKSLAGVTCHCASICRKRHAVSVLNPPAGAAPKSVAAVSDGDPDWTV